MATQHPTPRVYIACLASYNAGILHGDWTDATDEDEIGECVARVLKTSRQPGAEEVAIHDHEHFGDTIGEYTPISEVAEWGALIEKHGAGIVAGLHALGLRKVDEVTEAIEERYEGVHESWADFAAEYVEATCDLDGLPQIIRNHIDYASIGRDFDCGGDYSVVKIGVDMHFFSNR